HTRFSRDWSSDVCSSDLRRSSASCLNINAPCPLGVCAATTWANLMLMGADAVSAAWTMPTTDREIAQASVLMVRWIMLVPSCFYESVRSQAGAPFSGSRLPRTLQKAAGTTDDRGIDHLSVHHEHPFTTGSSSKDAIGPVKLLDAGHKRFMHHGDLTGMNAQHSAKAHFAGAGGKGGEATEVLDIGEHAVQRRGQAGQARLQHDAVTRLVEHALGTGCAAGQAEVQAQVQGAE